MTHSWPVFFAETHEVLGYSTNATLWTDVWSAS